MTGTAKKGTMYDKYKNSINEAERDLWLALNTNSDNFGVMLVNLIFKADKNNFEKLRLVYPEYIKTIEKWRKAAWLNGRTKSEEKKA